MRKIKYVASAFRRTFPARLKPDTTYRFALVFLCSASVALVAQGGGGLDPAQLLKEGGGRYVPSGPLRALPAGGATLKQGSVEEANLDPVLSMVDLVTIIGPAEECKERLHALEKAGVEELALAITVPGNDPGETLAALEALAPG